jgi:hypothetical protein
MSMSPFLVRLDGVVRLSKTWHMTSAALMKEPLMKFAFLGYHVEDNWAAMTKSEQDAMVEDCFAFDRKLLKDGNLIDDGAALQPSRTAKILRWKNGALLVTDGPFTETKEQLGGIGILEASDMTEAVELMSRHPALRYGSTFEIRPIDEESLQRQAAFVAKWRGAEPASDAKSVKFACLGYISEQGSASKSEFETMIEEVFAFDEERIKSGQWRSGVKLQSTGAAKTLRAKAGKVVVTDGPFAEIKEWLGGIVVLALKDIDQAVGVLSKHPALPFGIVLEIRPMEEAFDHRWQAQKAM